MLGSPFIKYYSVRYCTCSSAHLPVDVQVTSTFSHCGICSSEHEHNFYWRSCLQFFWLYIHTWDAVMYDNYTWDYFSRNCHFVFPLPTHFHYSLLSVGFSLYRRYLNVLEKISSWLFLYLYFWMEIYFYTVYMNQYIIVRFHVTVQYTPVLENVEVN